MKNRITKPTKYCVSSIIGLMLTSALHAGKPLWTYSAPSPASVAVAEGGVTTIQYTVTNQSSKSKNLILQSTPGLSASLCHLEGKGSTCLLEITVSGSHIPAQGLHAGPMMCEQGNLNQCYQPSEANLLNINRDRPFVAVGFYRPMANRQSPLSYTTPNNGQSWSSSFPDPIGPRIDNFIDVSCNAAGNCVAVGSYVNNIIGANQWFPLSYTSSNFGQTWTNASPAPVGSNDDDMLNGVSCTDTGHCVAVGSYLDAGGQYVPLSYTSSNFGQSWTSYSPAPIGTEDRLTGVSCDAIGNCVAVGYSRTVGGQYISLSYTSSNFGQSWVNSPILPIGTTDDGLQDVSCNDTGHCVAVGYYLTAGGGMIL